MIIITLMITLITIMITLIDNPPHAFAGGYEIVYDVLNHILGRPGAFSGIPLHLGHFRAHIEERIRRANPVVRGFFQPKKWILFIQSAIATRLKALPSFVREPCCELNVIGGDGTSIGVTIAKIDNVQPVWQPPMGLRPCVKDWGCMDRCAIGNHLSTSNAKEREAARTFLRNSTDPSNNPNKLANLREMLDCFEESLPKPLFNVLESWFSDDPNSNQWDPVRKLLRMCSYKDSLCGSIGCDALPFIRQAISLMCQPRPLSVPAEKTAWESCMRNMTLSGANSDILGTCESILRDMMSPSPEARQKLLLVASLLQYIGEHSLISCGGFSFSS